MRVNIFCPCKTLCCQHLWNPGLSRSLRPWTRGTVSLWDPGPQELSESLGHWTSGTVRVSGTLDPGNCQSLGPWTSEPVWVSGTLDPWNCQDGLLLRARVEEFTWPTATFHQGWLNFFCDSCSGHCCFPHYSVHSTMCPLAALGRNKQNCHHWQCGLHARVYQATSLPH